MQTVQCPHCRAMVQLPPDEVGGKVTCPSCHQEIPTVSIQAAPAGGPSAPAAEGQASPVASPSQGPALSGLASKLKSKPLIPLLGGGLVLAIFALCCCSGIAVIGSRFWTSSKPGEDYFPVSDKGRWEYTVKHEVTSSVLGKLPPQTGKAVVSMAGKQTINGKVYYKQHTTYTGLDWDNELRYIRIGKDGVYAIYGDESFGVVKTKPELLPEFQIYPLPLTAGKTWSVNEAGGDLIPFKAEAVESVTVAGKTYPGSLKITTQWSGGVAFARNKVETVRHLAPHVGMVKFVRKETVEGGGITTVGNSEWTLDKYKP